MRPYELTVAEAAEAVGSRRLSPVELVDSTLERIARVEPHLNAFTTVTADRARDAARRAETEIARGTHRGPLHGVPVGLKDLIDVAGLATTASPGSGPAIARGPTAPSRHGSTRPERPWWARPTPMSSPTD